jgi:RNase adaptor protein for sRNA GlmZ degradation
MDKTIDIYTWGNKRHKYCPVDTDKNFNVAGISSYKPHGVDLKKVTGRDPRLQRHIMRQKKFDLYMNTILTFIKKGASSISIYCHKGRHRSVATAEIVGQFMREEGWVVNIHHLDS